MKGDSTRFTFDPKKHYSSVMMQQGRIQLDSDWGMSRPRSSSITAVSPMMTSLDYAARQNIIQDSPWALAPAI